MGLWLCLLLTAAHPTKVALMPLTNGEGITPGVAEALTDAVAAEVRKRGVSLITQKEMIAVMGLERQKALLGCGNEQCLAELGGALGVDLLVTGAVSKLGQSYLVHLQVVDPVKAVTRAQSDRRKKGGSIDDVLDELPGMVDELFGSAVHSSGPIATNPAAGNPAATPPQPAVAALPSATAAKAPPPIADTAANLGDDASKLKLFTDGQGRYLATVPFGGSNAPLLSGDSNHLYLQRVYNRSSAGDTMFMLTFWEPRGAPASSQLVFRDHAYRLFCGNREVPLTVVPTGEATKLLSHAKLNGVRWQRRGVALARDDEGTYFYVDQAVSPEGSTDYHLFIGKKGATAYFPVTSVDRDADADLFSTAQGTLKIPKHYSNRENSTSADWIQPGGAKRQLTWLDPVASQKMIFFELGVYAGQPLGTPCDGLF